MIGALIQKFCDIYGMKFTVNRTMQHSSNRTQQKESYGIGEGKNEREQRTSLCVVVNKGNIYHTKNQITLFHI